MNRQQAWATKAFEAVEDVSNLDAESQGKYRTFCLKFPVLLIQSGLAQSLAFINSRKPAGNDRTEPMGERFVRDLAAAIEESDLVNRSRSVGVHEYVRLSAQALGAAAWFRRFAVRLAKAEGE